MTEIVKNSLVLDEPMDEPYFSKGNFRCFLCNHTFVESEEPWLLFEHRVQENGELECPLSTILSNALGCDLTKDDAHSSLLCTTCNDNVLKFEQVEQQYVDIQYTILKSYNRTAHHLGLPAIPVDLNGVLEIPIADDDDKNSTNIVDGIELNKFYLDGTFEEDLMCSSNYVMTDIGNESLIEKDNGDELSANSKKIIGDVQETSSDVTCENEIILPEVIDLETAESILSIPTDFNSKSVDGMIMYDDNFDDSPSIENSMHSKNKNIIAPNVLDDNDNSNDFSNLFCIIDDTNNEDSDQNTRTLRVRNADTSQELKYECNSNNYYCLSCDASQEYNSKAFSDHMHSVHKIRFYTCNLCSAGFVRRQDLDDHLNDHLGVNNNGSVFECNVCHKNFENSRRLRMHKRIHYTNVKQHECMECHKKFNSKNLLEEHNNIHTGNRPFKCNLCPKKFASKYTLQSHLKIHTERPRPYQCDECDKSFIYQQNLIQHKKLHSNIKDFVCEYCNKAFFTRYNLDIHKIIHTSNRPFACSMCDKTFARRAELKDHERIHTGEKPFKCDMCHMSFAQRSNLMTHKKSTHLNEKTHKCDICYRSFKRRRLLDYHKQAAHTGERPHKCNLCGASFVYPEHYKKHMRIHSGEKPYECEVCGKRFASSDNRNSHRFVHSNKKPYECMECGAGFMRKPLLLTHLDQTNHNSETIIVNQPQIKETLKVPVPNNLLKKPEVSLSDIIEHTEEYEDEDDVVSDVNEVINGQLIKNEVGDIKYLAFEDLDKDGKQTMTWVDICEDK